MAFLAQNRLISYIKFVIYRSFSESKNWLLSSFGSSDTSGYTNQPGGDIQSLANSSASWHSYSDSRVATVSLSYRFSKGKNLRLRQTGGSENEQKRVKN